MIKKLISFSILFINICSFEIGNINRNDLIPIKITSYKKTDNLYLRLDQNWGWTHSKKDININCFPSSWDNNLCSDPIKCWNNCAIEGIPQTQWENTYGLISSPDASSIRINYVTDGPYGQNVGARLYFLNTIGEYKGWDLLNREFSFTVDVSNVPCGLNGALYMIEMPVNPEGFNINNPANYGLGYGDAQCALDIKWLRGFANTNKTGVCSNELDIWEANSQGTHLAIHNCKDTGVFYCKNDKDCGITDRYSSMCDKDGAYYNPYQSGNTTLYGRGTSFSINTLKPFEVITQFITDNNNDNGNLISIKRFYKQDNKLIFGGELNDDIINKQKKLFKERNIHEEFGGMKSFGQSMKRQHVLSVSLWDDSAVNMLWLDSTYPVNSNAPGAKRGPCNGNQDPSYLRQQFKNSYVIFSDIKVDYLNNIKTTSPTSPTSSNIKTTSPNIKTTSSTTKRTSSSTTKTTSSTTKRTSSTTKRTSNLRTTKMNCNSIYQQCGGKNWNGAFCCQSNLKCYYQNDYYSQCLP